MKNFFLLAFALLLTGCGAQYPATTNLKLEIGSQPSGLYGDETTATLKGHDARKNDAVVVYRFKGESEIRIPNGTAPHALVAKSLADGLKEQGLEFVSGSPVRIEVDLNDLVAVVTRPKVLYSAKANSHLTLTIINRGFSLSKTYDREANRESVSRPSVQDLENMLNGQLDDIVKQILQDQEVHAAIVKK